jgi:hypothetical protein
VERDNKIKDNTIVFNGLTYGLVLSPYTGRVWLDRNLGATRIFSGVMEVARIVDVVLELNSCPSSFLPHW